MGIRAERDLNPLVPQALLDVLLAPDELSDSSLGEAPSAISSAIRADFARRCETAEHDLVRTRLNGWVSLLVGLVVLLRLMSLVEAVHGFAPTGSNGDDAAGRFYNCGVGCTLAASGTAVV